MCSPRTIGGATILGGESASLIEQLRMHRPVRVVIELDDHLTRPAHVDLGDDLLRGENCPAGTPASGEHRHRLELVAATGPGPDAAFEIGFEPQIVWRRASREGSSRSGRPMIATALPHRAVPQAKDVDVVELAASGARVEIPDPGCPIPGSLVGLPRRSDARATSEPMLSMVSCIEASTCWPSPVFSRCQSAVTIASARCTPVAWCGDGNAPSSAAHRRSRSPPSHHWSPERSSRTPCTRRVHPTCRIPCPGRRSDAGSPT